MAAVQLQRRTLYTQTIATKKITNETQHVIDYNEQKANIHNLQAGVQRYSTQENLELYIQLIFKFNCICWLLKLRVRLVREGNGGILLAVRRRPSTAAARDRSQARSCGICGGQNGTGAGFLRVLRFPLPMSFYQLLHTHQSSGVGANGPSSGLWTKWTQYHPTHAITKILLRNTRVALQWSCREWHGPFQSCSQEMECEIVALLCGPIHPLPHTPSWRSA
jgi:hypothetical protein